MTGNAPTTDKIGEQTDSPVTGAPNVAVEDENISDLPPLSLSDDIDFNAFQLHVDDVRGVQ